ncbi:MAG: 50S ribosomal protein L9 [Synergistaceae bacterium]|nr:50S ribosomal protein L9 [Synergistaceae bacterium]
MKVILKTDVNKLGKAGSLVDVSDGHARNFLIPKGLAIEATPGKLNEWKNEQARLKAKDAKLHAEALELQKRLQGKAVTVEGKAGENGKLFGSITASQISEALEAQHGLKDFDKRNIKLDETIKQPGSFPFSLKLYPGVQADMTLTVKVSQQ